MSAATLTVKGPNNQNRVLNNTVHSFIGGNAVGNNAQVVNNFAGAHFHLHFGGGPSAAAVPAQMPPANSATPARGQAACAPVLSKEDLTSLFDRVQKMPNAKVITVTLPEILNPESKAKAEGDIVAAVADVIGEIPEIKKEVESFLKIIDEKIEKAQLSVRIPDDLDEEMKVDENQDPAPNVPLSGTVVDLADEQEQRVVLYQEPPAVIDNEAKQQVVVYQKPAPANDQLVVGNPPVMIGDAVPAIANLPAAIERSTCDRITACALKLVKATASHAATAILAATIAVIAFK